MLGVTGVGFGVAAVTGGFLLSKKDQPHWEQDDSWKDEFELD